MHREIQAMGSRVQDRPRPVGYFTPSTLIPWHIEMARLQTQGYNFKQIAELLHKDVGTVRLVAKSPLYQSKLNELGHMADAEVAKIKARLLISAQDAMDVIEETLDDGAEFDKDVQKVRLTCAQDVLNRVGITGKKDEVQPIAIQVNNIIEQKYTDPSEALKRLDDFMAEYTIERKR